MKALFLLALLLPVPAFAAPCGSHSFTAPEKVQLAGPAALIVTHPSTLWDGRFSSKVGMDAAVAFAKKNGLPVVYLEGEEEKQTYFFSDCDPTYWVSSFGGEFEFPIETNHIYSVGGHWELCQRNTQEGLMQAWAHKRGVDLRFTQVMDGLYSYGGYVRDFDPYYASFRRFLEIVTYRKPGRDTWPHPKLNLLEMMGVIQDGAQQIDYLVRGLPSFSALGEEYEVQLFLNGEFVQVVRNSTGPRKSVLRFEFVDSLFDGEGYAPSLVDPGRKR